VIRAILTDIEGTTSSISFVKDVLFPFACKRLPAFVETHADKPEVQHWLHEAARDAGIIHAGRTEIVELLQRWIDEDRKATPLKALQGMIWDEGYRSGDFRAHVYPDVAPRLREWKEQGLDLYIYSSGSVPAQKLFFEFSEAGDLTALLSGYFDTEVGHKREAESYRRIATTIGMPAQEILFLSDIAEELDAAHAAGMRTTQLARPPAACPAHGTHPCVHAFDAIALD
jgi:enolase-phosphatase E1